MGSPRGEKTKLFRSPLWGAEDEISENTLTLTTFALDKGYIISTPTLDSFDWRALPIKEIIKNSTVDSGKPVILLLHDGGGNRKNTVKALPAIINFYKTRGYYFAKIA